MFGRRRLSSWVLDLEGLDYGVGEKLFAHLLDLGTPAMSHLDFNQFANSNVLDAIEPEGVQSVVNSAPCRIKQGRF